MSPRSSQSRGGSGGALFPAVAALLFAGAISIPSNPARAETPAALSIFASEPASLSIVEHARFRMSEASEHHSNHAKESKRAKQSQQSRLARQSFEADVMTSDEFARRFAEPGWRNTRHAHQSFGSGPDSVWLKFQIRFDATPGAKTAGSEAARAKQYHLVQQYAWLDRLTLWHAGPDGSLRRSVAGDMIPFAKRRPQHRLPVLKLQLQPGLNRFLLRVDSQSEKLIALKLRPADAGVDPLQTAWLFALGAAGIGGFISLLIALILNERLAWYYIAYVSSVATMMFFWEGFGHRFFYPHDPWFNDGLVQSLVCVFLFCLLEFWRRLLILSLQAPLLNRLIRITGATMLASALFALGPGEIQPYYDLIIYAGTLASATLMLASGAQAIRRGFTPAYWSMGGVALFTGATTLFSFSGIWMIPGNDCTRLAPYGAFVLEFALFLVSMVVRIRFLARDARIQEPGIEDTDPGESAGARTDSSKVGAPAGSRLRGVDVREMCRRLTHLLERERLYSDEDLSQERLGAILGLSRHQMTELFQLAYGANYYETVNRVRIAEAQRLLREEPERTVLSIATSVGFSSKSSFNAEFRKRCGLAPSEYRWRADS